MKTMIFPMPQVSPLDGSLNVVPYVIKDQQSGSQFSGWTPGAHLRTAIPQQTLAPPFSLYGWSLDLTLFRQAMSSFPPFGKLGQIHAGPIRNGTPDTSQSASVGSPPGAITSDETVNLETVFDPNIDGFPPDTTLYTGAVGVGLIRHSTQLPQPVGFDIGDTLLMALELLPSLSPGVRLVVVSAVFHLEYE